MDEIPVQIQRTKNSQKHTSSECNVLDGLVLDAFEAALKKDDFDLKALRPCIEHGQVVAEKDTKRFGELGFALIASIQTTHVYVPSSLFLLYNPRTNYLPHPLWYAEDRLVRDPLSTPAPSMHTRPYLFIPQQGPERVKNLFAFRNLIDSGARIAIGSDFPVRENGTSPHGEGGCFPEQRLTRVADLRGMTIDPACASFTEEHLGSLEHGKRADFAVISKDIMHVPLKEILDADVLATVIDGRVVYGSI
ncbi:N-substituted formamide deformylase [Hypsizygus marmoreus]|uniref:N-substituted formamide deformylase n=1 Tax=Hypsizygus marmoreus TaxID=39966 RepID=A0A369JRU2_HYPMA|nr:N-substituted formamide deformylase [Hypsizygus marmoreus]